MLRCVRNREGEETTPKERRTRTVQLSAVSIEWAGGAHTDGVADTVTAKIDVLPQKGIFMMALNK
jgi:hypothetical protein